jgi:SAM-dependent methyltransferase
VSATLTQSGASDLDTERVPRCLLCASEGTELHAELRDWVFGAPGVWRMVECRACRVAWLDPRLTRQGIGAAYATYYTHETQDKGNIFRVVVPLAGAIEQSRRRIARWFSDAAEDIRARRLGYPSSGDSSIGVGLLSRLMERVPAFRDSALLAVGALSPGAGRRVLDVGCGSGEFLQRMRTRGWDVVGVEPDPVAAARARSAELDVRDGSLADAAFADDTFDAIVLSHVIEHVHDPIALLRECGRVLRPGGVLLIMTPNLERIGHRRFGADWRGLEPPRHLHLFSSRSLSTSVRLAGLDLAEVRTSARWVRWLRLVCRVIKHRAGRESTAPGIAAYLESWAMSIVEDLRRSTDASSSEEIIMSARKAVVDQPRR